MVYCVRVFIVFEEDLISDFRIYSILFIIGYNFIYKGFEVYFVIFV